MCVHCAIEATQNWIERGCPLRIIFYTPLNSTQSSAGTGAAGDDLDELSWMNGKKKLSHVRSFAKHIVVLLQQRCLSTVQITS
jgi:hypothetical protein